MRRFLTITVLATSITIGTNLPAAAGVTITGGTDGGTISLSRAKPHHTEGRWRGPCANWWVGENLTPAIWNENPERGGRMMQRLIACVFTEWAPGESLTALIVADRESSYYPWAANPSGCQGLFQHQVDYWAGRAHAYVARSLFAPWKKWPNSSAPGRLIYDPRANAIAAAKMVASGGWGPWSTV